MAFFAEGASLTSAIYPPPPPWPTSCLKSSRMFRTLTTSLAVQVMYITQVKKCKPCKVRSFMPSFKYILTLTTDDIQHEKLKAKQLSIEKAKQHEVKMHKHEQAGKAADLIIQQSKSNRTGKQGQMEPRADSQKAIEDLQLVPDNAVS